MAQRELVELLVENPYQPPTGDLDAPRAKRERNLRWRVVPVTLLSVMGGASLAGSPLPLVRAYELPPADGGGITWVRIVATILIVLASCGYLYAAWTCWRGRWWRFAVVLASSLAAAALGQHLVADLPL